MPAWFSRDVEQGDAKQPLGLNGKEPLGLNGKADDPAYGAIEPNSTRIKETSGDDLLQPSPDGRYPFLDATRIIAVLCVAVDHNNHDFGAYNALFTQDWVLQYLYLVAGVCWGMSSRRLWSYELRLVAYFFVGVGVNWLAWIIKGLDWRRDFMDVVFQFWFVAGLIADIAILAPLKAHQKVLRERVRALQEEARPAKPFHFAMMIIAAIGFAALFQLVARPVATLLANPLYNFIRSLGDSTEFWGLPQSRDEAKDFVLTVTGYVALSGSNFCIVLAWPLLTDQLGWVFWMLVANTYTNRCILYRGPEERFFAAFDLVMLSMTCYFYGIKGRNLVGKYVTRYWLLGLLFCCWVWPLGTFQRQDEHPPETQPMRFRVNLLYAIFATFWLVAGERVVDPGIFSEDRLEFLNNWALCVFLVHKAIHIVVPRPFNWIIIIGLVPIFWWLSKRRGSEESRETKPAGRPTSPRR